MTRGPSRVWWSAWMVGVLGLLGPRAAEGNGRFPRAQYVVLGPGGASTSIALRATFGLVLSDDGGRSFRFLCEEAFEYLDGYDPSLALTRTGALLVGLEDGLQATRDRCGIRRVAELRDQSVVDLATDPSGQRVYAAIVSAELPPRARVARSEDGGESFRVPTAALEDVLLETVEVAPSDPRRVYASGTVRPGMRRVLYRSDDGGDTLRETRARFEGAAGVFVSGVDPRRPEVLYVRVATAPGMDAGEDEGASALLRSDDGGDSFRELARTVGPMRGFALASDGRRVWIGGPRREDGLQRSDEGGPFRRVADVPVECLRYHGGALWVCESFVRGGVALGRSLDEGATVQPALRFGDIQDPPRCATGTLVRDICTLRWPRIQSTLGGSRPDGSTSDRGMDAPGDRGGDNGGGDCSCRASLALRGAPPARSPLPAPGAGTAATLVVVMTEWRFSRRRGRRPRR